MRTDRRLTDEERWRLYLQLFPRGLEDPLLLQELAPEGWEQSPLRLVFHPTVDQMYEEAMRIHTNIQELLAARGRTGATPPPSLEEIRKAYRAEPSQPRKESGDLVGLCLWDVFSDNYELVFRRWTRITRNRLRRPDGTRPHGRSRRIATSMADGRTGGRPSTSPKEAHLPHPPGDGCGTATYDPSSPRASSGVEMHWEIRRHGQPITLEQYHSLPEAPLELIAGHLYGRQEHRVTLLGVLLQNVGIDAAVRLGDLAVWKEAIAARERAES